jgi:hypothetical protein
MKTVRIKPSRSASAFGVVVGLIGTGLGIVWVIPIFGTFGVFWTLMAGAMTAYSAFNAFSARGMAAQEIDIEDSDDSRIVHDDAAERLERLKGLRMNGLITEEEYQQKRSEIINKL